MSNCPICHSFVERVGDTLICKCGWTYSKKSDSSQAAVIFGMIFVFILIAGSLFHFFQWGSHGLDILFAGPDKKIEICMDLKKYDCVEKNYTKLFEMTNEKDLLARLGELQFKREKFIDAEKSYRLYFSKGGNSYEAAYYYAHSLAKTGDIESAIEYFDSILKSKPRVLMVTIMESYLEILISHNRIKKAKEILSWADEVSRGSENTENQIQSWRKKFKI